MENKKITQLLLSTPGACFLCLQDNKIIDEGGPPPDSDEDLNGGIIDLSSICRYLNINQRSLLLTSLENDGGTGIGGGLEQGQCAFSVNLCPKCLELTEKLNEIIIQLEQAKLMVNFHLSSFHKTLEGTEENWEESLEWINLQGRMHANPNNSFEAKLVKILRDEAKDKSLKILKKAEAAKPQVILPKLPAPQPRASPQPPPLSPPAFLYTSTNTGTLPSIKTLLSQLVSSNVIPSKKSPKSKLYRCPFCSKVLSSSKIALHLCCLHSDKLLSSHFPPSSPPSEEICRQVLQSQVIDKAQKSTASSSSSSAPRLGCHLCGITYCDGSLLKHHFLITHTDKLCEYLTNLNTNPQKFSKLLKPLKMTPSKSAQLSQSSESVSNLIRNIMESNLINPTNHSKNLFGRSDQRNKRYQCPFCESSPRHPKFAIHLANLHPDKLLDCVTPSIDKYKNDNPNYFKALCVKTLTKLVSMATKCLVGSSTRGGGGTSSSMSSKVGCHLCAAKYSDGRSLRHHFIVSHTDDLCEELVKMGKVKVKIPVQVKRKMGNDKQVKKVIRRIGVSGEKNCLICKQKFSKYDKLQKHLVTYHPEQLFLGCKPSGVGGEEWRGICKRFFGGEVKKATVGKLGNKIYRCRYCPLEGKSKSYRGHWYLVVHLAYQHWEEMEGKLNDKVEGMKGDEEEENTIGGGDDGGDQMLIEEEDASEFDMKPEVGAEMMMDEMDVVLDENSDKDDEEAYRETDDIGDPLQRKYGHLEEKGGVPSGDQSEPKEQFFKMEVNDDSIYSEIY